MNHTVALDGKVTGSGAMRIEGNGKVVFSSGWTDFSGGLTVTDAATASVFPGCSFGNGVVTVNGGAALEVAASGTATLRGGLTLASGASLAFNFTAKEVAPTLTVPSVAFYAGTATNIVVKISAADGIVGSAHTLTSSGGAFRGVTVSLDETSRPYWVKSVSVENGEIVMSVRSAGVIYVE